MIHLILLAAGSSKRYGKAKQFLIINGKPMWQWTLESFIGLVDDAVVVVPEGYKDLLPHSRQWMPIKFIAGGKSRTESSYFGVKNASNGVVLIHDAARPIVSSDLIKRVISCTLTNGAAIPVIPVRDTIKIVNGNNISKTLNRAQLVSVQTPQGFKTELIKEALKYTIVHNLEITDDASAVEAICKPVFTVKGDISNKKLTYTEDLKFIKELLCELE